MKRILVIEDELPLRKSLLHLLEMEGFEGVGAENGRVGVELAQKKRPDLILCDVTMPELDGYGVLEALRQEPLTATIPFVFLTARAAKAEVREGMNLGADDYLTKPFTRSELLDTITSRLDKHAIVQAQAQKKLDELRLNLAQSLPHEFITPLSIILSSADLLISQHDDLRPEQSLEMARKIYRNAERLNRLIQNFLLYAELELTATNPAKVAALRQNRSGSSREIVTLLAREKARQTNRAADLELDLQEASLPIDSRKFHKLVEELVDNAFKHSEAGTPVKITSAVGDGKYTLSVLNQGHGLTAEQIASFGGYVQFERKIYEQQGAGLGLTIAKRLAELHGGKLSAESEPNSQTIFTVVIPL